MQNLNKNLPCNAHQVYEQETITPQKPTTRKKMKKKTNANQFFFETYNIQLDNPVIMNLKPAFEVSEKIRRTTCHVLKLSITKPYRKITESRFSAKVFFSELITNGVSSKAMYGFSWLGESDSVTCYEDNLEIKGRFHRDTGDKFDFLLFALILQRTDNRVDRKEEKTYKTHVVINGINTVVDITGTDTVDKVTGNDTVDEITDIETVYDGKDTVDYKTNGNYTVDEVAGTETVGKLTRTNTVSFEQIIIGTFEIHDTRSARSKILKWNIFQ